MPHTLNYMRAAHDPYR